MDALEQHHCEYNEKTRSFNLTPVQDWTTDPVDAFKYGCQMPSYAFSRTWEEDSVDGWGGNQPGYNAELDRVAI